MREAGAGGAKAMMMKSNIAPVIDELGDTRSRIARLELKEAALRKQVAELGAGDHHGRRWMAKVKMQSTDRVDIKRLRANHPAIAKACTVTKTGPYVTMKPEIVEDI
jgi:hypothetical protein